MQPDSLTGTGTKNGGTSDIEKMQVQPRSTMLGGLEERLTDQEFVDLLAYLLS